MFILRECFGFWEVIFLWGCKHPSIRPSIFYFCYSCTKGHKVCVAKVRFLLRQGPTQRNHYLSSHLQQLANHCTALCPDTSTMKSIWVCLSVRLACRLPGSRPQRGSSFGDSLLPLTLLLGEHQFCISLCQPAWYDSLHAIYTTFHMNKYLTIKLEGHKSLCLRPGTLTDTVGVGAWVSGVSSRKLHSLTLPCIAKWAIVLFHLSVSLSV